MNLANKPITFLSLFRKYGGNIKNAHELELRAAAKALPPYQNALQAFFAAQKEYKREHKLTLANYETSTPASRTRSYRSVCRPRVFRRTQSSTAK